MSNERQYSLRERIGALALDIPRYIPRLFGNKGSWVNICNRQDTIEKPSNGPGVLCPGRWSSDLHASHVYPYLGHIIMRKALREWPIRFNGKAHQEGPPDISFVIPHCGADRVPLLQTTLQTILSQGNISVECIIVEQSTKREITELPPGVRYIYLPHKTDTNGWYKSWAFNIGVKEARANIVVCHDGDILVPCNYGLEILKHMHGRDREVLHLQRFLFCLNPTDTNKITTSKKLPNNTIPERVRQNWQGGTLAIKKNAFFRIGGYDEQFVGWGGEDNEFYDRCTTLNGWRYGYLPFVHLWHSPQAEKDSAVREQNQEFLQNRLAIPTFERILALRNDS